MARSRRVLANLEERIQKFIDTAFFWPVEVGEIFDATSYCKSEQTRLDHNSAKVARIENSFGGSIGGVFLCYWSNFQLGRWSVGLSFFILHSSFLPVSGSKGKG